MTGGLFATSADSSAAAPELKGQPPQPSAPPSSTAPKSNARAPDGQLGPGSGEIDAAPLGAGLWSVSAADIPCPPDRDKPVRLIPGRDLDVGGTERSTHGQTARDDTMRSRRRQAEKVAAEVDR
jgi:hypothetical protein